MGCITYGLKNARGDEKPDENPTKSLIRIKSNPVVVMMTFLALPLAMSVTKYAILLLVIVVVVPSLIRWLEREKPLQVLTAGDEAAACAIKLPPPDKKADSDAAPKTETKTETASGTGGDSASTSNGTPPAGKTGDKGGARKKG